MMGKKGKRFRSATGAPAEPRLVPTPDEIKTMRAIGELASSCTVPIYSRTSATNPDPVIEGSGLLLRVGTYRFLLTAAHVADISGKQRKTLWLKRPGEKLSFTPIGSGLRYYCTHSEDYRHEDDPLDMAVTVLMPEQVTDLEVDHTFLRLDQLDPTDDHAPQPSAYLVTGFPSVMSGQGPLLYSTNGMLFGGIKYTKDPSLARGLDTDLHVAIEFEDTRIVGLDGTHLTLPDPGGMSGGGIWRTLDWGAPRHARGPEYVRLVGLVQSWEKQPSVIIGTQVEYVLYMIAANFPETRSVIRLYAALAWNRPGWRPRVLSRIV